MQEKYNVTGMTCAACQARVQKSVSNLTGVQECNVNLLKNSMVVTYDDSPAVSHRLKQLKSAGLIVSRRDGKEVYYRTADTEPAQNFHHMIEWLVKIACPSQVETQKGTPLKKKNPKLSLKNSKRFQTAPSP